MQEKNIIHSTDATDAKLAIKIINRLNKRFKQAVCGKFALQFSDEFVGNSS
jgi:hypothetical protein